MPVRYVSWLATTLQGNLGYARSRGEPVNDVVVSGLLASATLMLTALAIGILLGIPLGVMSALRQYSSLDYGLTDVRVPRDLHAVVPARRSPGCTSSGCSSRSSRSAGMQTAGRAVHIPDFLPHLALPAISSASATSRS